MSDGAAPSGSGSSLVIYGSTGRRLQFSKQDLKMPDHVGKLPEAAFYEKQWEAVSGFWFNRVLRESALQQLEVADIIGLIEKDIEKRWQTRRAQSAMYKKKKRLLAAAGGPAGVPSSSILLTNVCALDEYKGGGTVESRPALLAAIAGRVEAVAADVVTAAEVMVDTSGAAPGEAPAKRQRTEGDNPEASKAEEQDEVDRETAVAPPFDDRVAVVCTLSSKDKAAQAIASLHGSVFDGRKVICRFWGA